MPNIITNKAHVAVNVAAYQRTLINQFNESIRYGLNEHDTSINKSLWQNIQTVEMYDWLNKNNCCSKHIQCNFTHIQNTLQYLKNLKLNINTTDCC